MIDLFSSLYIVFYGVYRLSEYYMLNKFKIFNKKSEWEWTSLLITIPYTAVISLPLIEYIFTHKSINLFFFAGGFLLFIIALYIRIDAYRNLKGEFSMFIELPGKIVKTGIFRKIRHPLYLSDTIFYFACPLLLNSNYSYFASILGFSCILVRIYFEEKYLASKMQGYTEYMKETKMFIPGIL